LEADDVAVLDFALRERLLELHDLDHTRLDLLVKLHRRRWCPHHPLVDDRNQIANLAGPRDVCSPDADQLLFRSLEVFEEDHDLVWLRVRLCRVSHDVEVEPQVGLPCGHVRPDGFHV